MTCLRLKPAALTAALVVMAGSSHAVTLLDEGFDAVPALTGGGWVIANLSSPVGSIPEGWFQGQLGIGIEAQAGAATSYAGANFNNAAVGGTLNTWLITPEFSTATATVISFWAKSANDPGYFDQIAYGLSSGSASPGSFTLSPAVTVAGDWTRYTVNYAAQGAGSVARFAIQYTGLADSSDFIGVDTLNVSAVPEPMSWLMLGTGLLGLAARRRLAAKR